MNGWICSFHSILSFFIYLRRVGEGYDVGISFFCRWILFFYHFFVGISFFFNLEECQVKKAV